MFFAIQSDAKGVPNRRNMWSQVSHQPQMSSNIGLSGWGQCRSSKTHNRSFSVSDAHSIGNEASPWNVASGASLSGNSGSFSPSDDRSPMVGRASEGRQAAPGCENDAV